jgi:hypothetical protein
MTSTGSAQTLAERAGVGYITSGAAHTQAHVRRTCVTPLDVGTATRVRDATCDVVAIEPIGSRDGYRMYAARYRRFSLVEWTQPADSVEWDELVLFRSAAERDTLVPVWHVRTERAIELVSGVKAQPRDGVLLIEVLLCLNGTGGCTRNYLLDSSAGLEYMTMTFADELRAQLSEGDRLHKGMTLDLETLRGTWPVAEQSDANCCPSRVFDYVVRLEGADLVLVSSALRGSGQK